MSWVRAHPSEALPLAFKSFSEEDISNYQSRGPLTPEINDAAEVLWYSSHQDIIHLMLICYHKRPRTRNNMQHPVPSTAFALSFLDSDLGLSEAQKLSARSIINCGKKGDGALLFDHNTSPASAPPPASAPAPVPSPSPAPVPAPHTMGTTRGTTRRREVDDDGGMAVKKQ